MKGVTTSITRRALMLALATSSPAAVAADDVWRPTDSNSVWQAECGVCHMAFPPALLSRENWRLLMQGLERHFGANASLDATSRDGITSFLERNAGSSRGHSADSLRITETAWFVKKHKNSVGLIAKGQVKSLADCVVCHKGEETSGE
jgi:mono/diheme cytochrome c family protein